MRLSNTATDSSASQNHKPRSPPHAGSSPRPLHHRSSRSQHAPAPAHSRAHTPHPTSPPPRSHRNPATTIEQSHAAATTPLLSRLPPPQRLAIRDQNRRRLFAMLRLGQ